MNHDSSTTLYFGQENSVGLTYWRSAICRVQNGRNSVVCKQRVGHILHYTGVVDWYSSGSSFSSYRARDCNGPGFPVVANIVSASTTDIPLWMLLRKLLVTDKFLIN